MNGCHGVTRIMGRNVFDGLRVSINPADTKNNAGGVAYAMSPEQAFAQLMLTGTFNNTYHVSGGVQLESFLDLASRVGPDFRHKAAVYAAENGGSRLAQYAAIAVSMANGDVADGFNAAFKKVVRGVPQVRELAGIFRSGVLGRRSFGTRPKRLLKGVLEGMPAEALFKGSVGDKPSFGDVIKLLHPKPTDDSQRALYAREIGRPYNPELLPVLVQQYDTFKKDGGVVPQIDIRLLQGLGLTDTQWVSVIPGFSWQTLRMNVRRWHEKGLFQKFPGLVDTIAARISNREEILRARPEAYQLLMAYLATKAQFGFPSAISEAFQDAMEIALELVPSFGEKVAIAVDVSGSMACPLTGDRAGGTSNVRKVDVASLFAAAVLRKNPDSLVLPFHGQVLSCQLNPRDSVMTNAEKLANLCSNGTNCAAPVRELVNRKVSVDTIVMFSDDESWMNPEGRTTGPSTSSAYYTGAYPATGLMDAFTDYKNKVNRNARLVCVDLEPNMTTQVINRKDILNIGGFSDSVFKLVSLFATGDFDGDLLVKKIQSMIIE